MKALFAGTFARSLGEEGVGGEHPFGIMAPQDRTVNNSKSRPKYKMESLRRDLRRGGWECFEGEKKSSSLRFLQIISRDASPTSTELADDRSSCLPEK